MENLRKALNKLSNESSLDNFEWGTPNNCPISIPANLKDDYSRNTFLKDNFSETILKDQTLASHYWAIQDWDGIGSFKKSEKNDFRIRKFLSELEKNL